MSTNWSTIAGRAPPGSPAEETAALARARRSRRRCTNGRRSTCPMGVASSFHANDPYPIYLARGQGIARVGRRRHRVPRLPRRLRRRTSSGHAHPKIVEAIERAARTGTHFAATTPSHRRAGRGAVPALPARAGPVRELRHRGDHGRHPHRARARPAATTSSKIEGSYHGHHDAVMFSVVPERRR